jgi:hypothetical protein
MARKSAKSGRVSADGTIGKYRGNTRWFVPVLAEIKKIFPRKTAAELAVITGRSIRICETWISGQGAPGGDSLAAMLCSQHGDRLHQALIRSVTFDWAEAARDNYEISKIRQTQAEAARRLEALERKRGDR